MKANLNSVRKALAGKTPEQAAAICAKAAVNAYGPVIDKMIAEGYSPKVASDFITNHVLDLLNGKVEGYPVD